MDFSDFLIFVEAFEKSTETGIAETHPIETLTEVVVQDLPADTSGTDIYTYYSLRDSAIVSSADSNSTAWDIAFKSTTIMLNGGSGGPGEAAAIVLTATDYDTLSAAPATGYQTDEPGNPAVTGWYTYTGPTGTPPHAILMNPGVVIAIRTADGRYAKLKFTSYYQGGEPVPSAESEARFYTFTYTFQPDGSRQLQ